MARTVSLPVVLFVSQGTGLLGSALIVALSGRGLPGAAQELAGLGAGAGAVGGLACFYRALATGTMSVVAPIASTGVVDSGGCGCARRRSPRADPGARHARCRDGRGALSRHPDPDRKPADRRSHRRMIELALLAAVGFGSYFLLAHVAVRGGVGWLLLNAHITTVLGVLVGGAFVRKTLRSANPRSQQIGDSRSARSGRHGPLRDRQSPRPAEHRRRRRVALSSGHRAARAQRSARACGPRAGARHRPGTRWRCVDRGMIVRAERNIRVLAGS